MENVKTSSRYDRISAFFFRRSKAMSLLLAWMLMSTGLLAQADFVLLPATQTVNVGDNGNLTLEIQAGAQLIDGAEAHLDFDPSVLQITGVTFQASAELPTTLLAATYDNTTGTVDASYGNLSGSTASGTFTYLNIDYLAVGAGVADFTYDFTFPTRITDITFTSSGSVLGTATGASVTVNNPAPAFQLCVGCGNTALTAFGRSFVADPNNAPPVGAGFTRTAGKAFKNYSGAIAGTTSGSDEELLFQKEIYGGATGTGGNNPNFAYAVPVANGTYQVELYFAEVFHPGSGGRIFDVLLEGNVILDEYDLVDPVKDGLGANQTAITRTYFIDVTDGQVDIQVGPASTDNGKLAGFCITAVSSANLHPTTSIGNLSCDANAPATLAVSLNDPESDALTVNLFGLPASLSYNATTGQIEGTPLPTDAGTYTVNAIVSDGTSSAVTEEFTLTVNPPANDNSPTIAPLTDVEVSEGGTVSVNVSITDDFNPAASIVVYDKSVLGTNNPFLPGGVVDPADYSFTDNGSGNYAFSWTTAPGDGRSYYAVVTADDGVNPVVEEVFTINVGIDPTTTFPARYFSNPLPWYGSSNPGAGFTVAIESNATQNIGYIGAGEFVEYVIEVPAGTYTATVSAAKGVTGNTNVTLTDPSGVVGTIGPVTNNGGGWQDYADFSTQITLATSGLQTLRLDFDAGINIQELTLTPFVGNNAPIVTITAPADGSSYFSGDNINFTATSNDVEEGDISAGISWSSDLDGALGVGAGININTLTVGNHVITATSVDNDLTDPQTGTASITVTINQPAPACNVTYRVNAGGTLFTDPNGNFEEDQAVLAADAGGTAGTGTPSPYYDNSTFDLTFATAVAIGTNNTGYPDALFQTERYSTGTTMDWAFPVANGVYDVKMLFCEVWTGEAANPRVFDVTVEGDLALDDYRPSGPTGADYNVAKVETYTATVTDGVLSISFIKGTQNPAIKGFDICFVSALNPPVVTISAPTASQAVDRGVDVTLTGTANDTEDGDISANLVWTSNDPQASTNPLNGTGASITGQFARPGTTTITATVTDSDGQQGSATVDVEVASPVVTITGPAAGGSVVGPDITVDWTATNILYSLAEHFHIYVNPVDPANPDYTNRISTASQVGVTTWNLGLTEGIVAGSNTIVIIAADQFHDEFTDPGARDQVTFTVTDNGLPVITLLGADPLILTQGDPYTEPGATASDDFDGDISGDIVIDASAVDVNVVGTYSVTYDVDDAAGNSAVQVTRTVEVQAAPLTDVFFVVNPPTQTVNENDVVTVTAQVLANAQPLDGVELHLTFDPTVLQVQSVTNLSGTEFPVGIIAPVFDNTLGTIDFAAGNFGPSFPSGTIDLLSIEFTAVGGPSSDIDFSTSAPLSNATFAGASVLSGSTLATVNVNENPELVITPGTISVSVGIDGSTTDTYVVDVNDASTMPGPAPITIIDDATGLAATWVSTVATAGQGVSQTLSFDATGLPAGTYTATMTAGPVAGYDDGFATISMVVQAPPAPGAFIAVTPGGALAASTFSGGSWQITNTGNIDITSVSIDLSTGILPDMVWDPTGSGGDATAACLAPGAGAALTGFVVPTDPCADPFSVPRNGGFDMATLNFTDFNNGELFTFASDNDPNSIQGVAGAGNAGAVSGYEMIGATITVTFADGTVLTGSLFEEGSLGGANLTLAPAPPAAPSIELVGFPGQDKIIVTDINQTVTVSGNPGDIVTLLQMDSRLFIASGDAPFNVSPFDSIFYANEAMSGKAVFTQTVGAGGTVDIPVTLFQTAGAAGTPSGGKNQFVAVTTPGPYSTSSPSSLTSNVLTVRYFPGYNPAAFVQVTPGATLPASTFTANSFQIQNTGTVDIVSVSIDLSTGYLMDVVFDPIGTAGDNGAKCLTPDAVVGTPGYVVTTDPCSDPFSAFQNGVDAQDGYQIVSLDFSDFNGGEQFNFSVDLDPTSIKNDVTTGDAGAISGAELVGAAVTIQFADGTTLTRCLWTDGSDGGSAVELTLDDLPTPAISMQGFASSPIQTADLNQTIDISGPANAEVVLLQWDTRLYIDAGSPNPYDIDPFEANENMAKVIYTGTLDPAGLLSIPVTLLETASINAGPDGGLNHFMAVVTDTGITSCMSNVIIVEVIPSCAVVNQTPVLCEADAEVVDLTAYEAAMTLETGTFAYATGGTPIVDPTMVKVMDGQVIDVTFSGANGCMEPVTITFTVNPTDTIYVDATTCDPAGVGVTQNLLTNQYGCDSLVVTNTVLVTISANLANVSCNDNGTPFDPADDYITFELAPSGANLGPDYIVTGDVTSTEVPYTAGATVFSSAPGTAGAGDLTITVTDTASGCFEVVTVVDPGVCSAQDVVKVTFGNAYGTTGYDVCVPVTVENFVDIGSGQGTVIWDPAVVSWDGVTAYGPLGMDTTSFQLLAPGQLLFSYSIPDPIANPNGETLVDGDTLFYLCFTAIGATGTSTVVEIGNGPVPVEFARFLTLPPTAVPTQVVGGLIEIIDPITISGAAFSMAGDSIPETKFRSLTPVPVKDSITASFYAFGIPANQDGLIDAQKPVDSDPDAGITTLDILLLKLHIFGTLPFNSPYQLLAGDVNNSGTITTLDILLIQNIIFQNLVSYPQITGQFKLWRMLPDDYVFPDPLNPWNAPDFRNHPNVQPPGLTDQNFLGLKLGDVNFSWLPPGNGLKMESFGEVVMNIRTPQAQIGETITVPVTTSQFRDIAAFSHSLSWDPAIYRFESLKAAELAPTFSDNLAFTGKMPLLWVQDLGNGLHLPDHTELYELVFTVIGLPKEEDVISFSSEVVPAEAYSGQLLRYTLTGLDNHTTTDQTTSVDNLEEYGFFQNVPNPFYDQTEFRFTLPESQEVTIEVYNSIGQQIWRSRDRYSQGVNAVTWNRVTSSGLPVASGVYTVVLTAGPHQQTLRISATSNR